MFVIGFLQELVAEHTDIVDAVSSTWGQALAQEKGPGPAVFVRTLIADWVTDEVYEASFTESLRESSRSVLTQSKRFT
jgi:hypothetical protein